VQVRLTSASDAVGGRPSTAQPRRWRANTPCQRVRVSRRSIATDGSCSTTVYRRFLLGPTFELAQRVESQLSAAHTAQLRLHMALEMADTHAERVRCLALAQQQTWLWTISLHGVYDHEGCRTARERCFSLLPPVGWATPDAWPVPTHRTRTRAKLGGPAIRALTNWRRRRVSRQALQPSGGAPGFHVCVTLPPSWRSVSE